MSEWNGHPLMNADRDGWHLLRFEDHEYSEPMWWDARKGCWRADPQDLFSLDSGHAETVGYAYVAGMVTPEEWEGRKNG